MALDDVAPSSQGIRLLRRKRMMLKVGALSDDGIH